MVREQPRVHFFGKGKSFENNSMISKIPIPIWSLLLYNKEKLWEVI